MSRICSRCGTGNPTLRVREGDRWVRVCRDCVTHGEIVTVELPAGDVVGEVTEVTP